MSDAENDTPNANGKRTSALQLGPRKKMYASSYLSLIISLTNC